MREFQIFNSKRGYLLMQKNERGQFQPVQCSKEPFPGVMCSGVGFPGGWSGKVYKVESPPESEPKNPFSILEL